MYIVPIEVMQKYEWCKWNISQNNSLSLHHNNCNLIGMTKILTAIFVAHILRYKRSWNCTIRVRVRVKFLLSNILIQKLFARLQHMLKFQKWTSWSRTHARNATGRSMIPSGAILWQHAVVSLGLMSPGAATDGCHPIFSWKNLTTFF